jgi:hypothetical protein
MFSNNKKLSFQIIIVAERRLFIPSLAKERGGPAYAGPG